MTNITSTKVVAAKDAGHGGTVYLTSCDAWTDDVRIAELLTEEDTDWRLAFANRLREVVDATLTEAVEDSQGLAQLVAA